jgi:transcriptional regulator with XRE-family HTH domain
MTVTSAKSAEVMDVALGAAVRLRRRAIGMSQDALAEQCKISFQQIQKYENGVNRISFSRLVQIAKALKCRVVDLLEVLDATEYDADNAVNFLSCMRTPGSAELLTAYEQMSPDSRATLVNFLRALTGTSKLKQAA